MYTFTTRRLASACALGLLATSLVWGGCAADAGAPDDLEDVGEAGMTFEEFLALVYHDPLTGNYIVDGDTPIPSFEALERYYLEHVQEGALAVRQIASGSLLVDAKWTSTQKKNLTYCVSTTFGSNYSLVVSAMANAAAAWEAAANVDFIHSSSHDCNCTNSNAGVVFDVRPTNAGLYLAAAFFPDFPRSQRSLLIDSLSFGSIAPYTLTGILRHELGHALGFVHEHIRPQASPAGPCAEVSYWRGLTVYDSASVMHYPWCNGSNHGDLVLTAKDKAGAAALYGAPIVEEEEEEPGMCGVCPPGKDCHCGDICRNIGSICP
jgi:hypothetical protein